MKAKEKVMKAQKEVMKAKKKVMKAQKKVMKVAHHHHHRPLKKVMKATLLQSLKAFLTGEYLLL